MSGQVSQMLDPQKFRGKAKEGLLIRDSFFDSLITNIAILVIALPAIDWIYTLIPNIKNTPTIQ